MFSYVTMYFIKWVFSTVNCFLETGHSPGSVAQTPSDHH
jgi:hypothetical protein